MARQTDRRHAQGDASRRTILDATLRIAGERGYVGTTLAQVTKASGLPASSVYWHFRNKDELLADALEHGFRIWDDETPPWSEFDAGRPRVEALVDELGTLSRRLDEEPGFWRMGLMIALETGPAVGERPRERFLAVRAAALARMSAWWAQSLATEDDGDEGARADRARTLALLTLVAMDGLFLAHQSDAAEDLQPPVHLLAVGLDAVARHLMSGRALPRSGRAPAPAPHLVDADPDSGRSRLLRAAAEVAAESGYDGASISRICERAGLPASSLYWHFKDKDDLLAEVIEYSYQEWFVAQPSWRPPAPGTTWQQALLEHYSVTLRSLAGRPLFLRMGHLLLLLQRADPPAARARFIAVRRQARLVSQQWYADVLGPDADPHLPGAMSLLTIALSDGLFISNQIDVPTWDVELFDELLVTMLAAVAAPLARL